MNFLLAHLSDPHIGPLPKIPLRGYFNKRLTGAINWRRSRAHIHNMTVFDSLVADIRAQSPGHVALTGDLANVGYAPEFPLALGHVRPLGAPADVSIIPGNHDVYVGGSLEAMEASFAPFMLGDGAAGPPRYPYLRRRGPLALIGLNTGVPTAPFMATGRLGKAQLAAFAELLRATADAFRVVMIHHPPLSEGAHFGRNLIDSADFETVLRQCGAELVLHGHNHRHSLHFAAGPSGRIPVIGAGSASAVPGTPEHRAEYNLIHLDLAAAPAISIERRGLLPESRTISRLAVMTLPSS